MIEFPRAAFIADELATEAEFMSFGTNDLTQTTLGFSRDDSGKFIPSYLARNIFEKDPFQTIDQEGVGKVMKMALTKARSTRKNIDVGICGEHGGDPASVEFCHRIGLSNVSCSPYRVPIAMLAAAQAAIKGKAEAAKAAQAQKTVPNSQQQRVLAAQANNILSKVGSVQKQVNNTKPVPKGAVSIRDEIRSIVKQELAQMKNQNSQVKTVVVQKKPVQNVARVANTQNLPKNIEQRMNNQVQKKQVLIVQNKPKQIQVVIQQKKAIQPVPAQPALKVGLNPGNKRGESVNNPVLAAQATDLLSRIAKKK
jgi:hypothetical protein